MNAVVTTEDRRASPVERYVADVLPPGKAQDMFSALPAHVSPDRFRRNLINAVMKEPKLLKIDPRIVYREVSKIAALGLLLDPQLGEAYLIADSRGDVQARVGYRGLIKLARQSGEIDVSYARDVCENDVFEVIEGTSRSITHKPVYTEDRGEARAYYAVLIFKNGASDFEVMSLGEVHRIRDRSDAYRAWKDGKIRSTPWGTDEGEMSKKTVLRRLLKRAPMSPELADVLRREDEFDQRDARDVTPVQIVRNPLDDEPPPAIEDHSDEHEGHADDDGVIDHDPAPATDDDGPEPADEPDGEDEFAEIRARGAQAASQGRPRKAPNDLSPPEAEAWEAGYAAQKEAGDG